MRAEKQADVPTMAQLAPESKIKHLIYHFLRMPPSSGWFAGRALAISQVETPFFIWMDDDFQIDPQTDLRKFLDVIQKTGFDVISGALNAN